MIPIKTDVKKYGGSYYLNVPKVLADHYGIEKGDIVEYKPRTIDGQKVLVMFIEKGSGEDE